VAGRSLTVTAERVPWSELRTAMLAKFEQGEHIALVGPTGSGKTTLMVDLLDGFHQAGGSLCMLANKPRDPLLTKLMKDGWPRIKKWPPDYGDRQKRRVILWPAYGRASQARRNRGTFEYALDMMINEGGWFVALDELRYFTEQLGLRHLLDEIWNGARSSNITLIAGAQGTTWTPKGHRDQRSWAFLFKPNDLEERKEYASVAGDRDAAAELGLLRRHEFLLVRGERRYISKVGT
jgi:energy-coupling factor transporter ATP-binding protein EcfA2